MARSHNVEEHISMWYRQNENNPPFMFCWIAFVLRNPKIQRTSRTR